MKAALLFVTESDFSHASFWHSQLVPHLELFNLYVYSKQPLLNSFLDSHRIAYRGSKRIVAQQTLLQAAIKDATNQSFIFLSNSSLPLYPLEAIYRFLRHNPHSYLRYGQTWWPTQLPRTLLEIPFEHRWGQSEWMALNRKHAELMAEDQWMMSVASSYPEAQESYPIVLFSLLNRLNEIINRSLIGTLPNFIVNEEEIIEGMKRKGYLFARPFHPSFPTEKLEELRRKEPFLQELDLFPPYHLDNREELPY